MLVINHGLDSGPNEPDTTKVIVVGESLALKLENKENKENKMMMSMPILTVKKLRLRRLRHLS